MKRSARRSSSCYLRQCTPKLISHLRMNLAASFHVNKFYRSSARFRRFHWEKRRDMAWCIAVLFDLGTEDILQIIIKNCAS